MLNGPIISSDSALRRVPDGLNHRQRLFVDAVRYSIEMADTAFTRIGAVAVGMGDDGALPEGVGFAAVFLDAWTVVDSVHRLRALIEHFPNAKKGPPKEFFLRNTAGVLALRNAVQHLIGEFGKDSTADDLPWGRLCWVSGGAPGQALKLRMMVAGSVTGTIHPLVNPLGRMFHPPVDFITLDAHGFTLDLSDTMRSVAKVATSIEAGWAEAIKTHPPHAPADIMISLDISPDSPEEPT